jgi:hypothetical protein
MMGDFHYHPGEPAVIKLPLDRFLPTVPTGCFRSWLKENVPPGSWIIDPFGLHPLVALEAAQAGYKILVSCNNPILAILYEVLASAPNAADFKAILADLAAEKKGDQRLEQFISSLYETKCPNCNKSMPAIKFVWDREKQVPIRRVINCPDCGGEKELAVEDADIQKVKKIAEITLPRSWALERMGGLTEDQQAIATEAIKNHTARSLYVLFTLFNRVEAMNMTERQSILIKALLICACDLANTLWPLGESHPRPLQLGTPPQFNEFNLWSQMEDTILQWCQYKEAIPFVKYPSDLPDSYGICLHPGKVRFILPIKAPIEPAAIVTVLPRANQAFWTLSALWSGWMIGKEAITPIRSVLDRQRYDWHWQTQALYNTLTPLQHRLPTIPFFALLSDLAPGSLLATLTGAQMGGWDMAGMAIRSDEDVGQFLWTKAIGTPVFLESDFAAKVNQELETAMEEQAEPISYLEAFSIELETVLRERRLVKYDEQVPLDLLSGMQSILIDGLTNSGKFRSFGAAASPTLNAWSLERRAENRQTLSEKVEERVATLMEEKDSGTDLDIDRAICADFHGIIIPAWQLVRTCIASYNESDPGPSGRWTFRREDAYRSRQSEMKQILISLKQMAQHFSLVSEGENPVLWRDDKGKVIFLFLASCSTTVNPFLSQISGVGAENIAWILPGSRVPLLGFRLQKDAQLVQDLAGWHFIKYRHFRTLQEMTTSDLLEWKSLLDADPVDWERSQQIPML